MPTVALDSNVVSAIFRPDDTLHVASRVAIQEWEKRGAALVLPVVVWSEVLTGVLCSSPRDEATLTAFRDKAMDRVLSVDVEIATTAARLRARDRGLRIPDALIVATAQRAGVDALLTGDLKLKRVDPDLVQVIRP